MRRSSSGATTRSRRIRLARGSSWARASSTRATAHGSRCSSHGGCRPTRRPARSAGRRCPCRPRTSPRSTSRTLPSARSSTPRTSPPPSPPRHARCRPSSQAVAAAAVVAAAQYSRRHPPTPPQPVTAIFPLSEIGSASARGPCATRPSYRSPSSRRARRWRVASRQAPSSALASHSTNTERATKRR